MTPGDRLITTHSSELSNASEVLLNCKIEKLPVVDDEGHLVGLITYKDITKVQDHPNACKDAKGRLRVAAGVGITPRCAGSCEGARRGGCGCRGARLRARGIR